MIGESKEAEHSENSNYTKHMARESKRPFRPYLVAASLIRHIPHEEEEELEAQISLFTEAATILDILDAD